MAARASAAASWAITGSPSYASVKTTLPKVWSKCSWVFTTATTSPTPSRRTSSTSRAALDLGGAGVDDQQAPVTGDDPDVDVEGLEAGDPAAVGDLDEAVVVGDVARKVGHAGQATAGR